MQVDPFGVIAAVRDALANQGTNPYRAAVAAGLPGHSIRYLLEGRKTRLDRLIEICRALDLEFYVGPPRPSAAALPPDTEHHRWGDRKGKEVKPVDVSVREGHSPAGFSPNGCASYGLDFLLEFDLDPDFCEVVEIFDDSMAPQFPAGAAGLVDRRRTERADGCVYALGVPELTVRRARETRYGWLASADDARFESFPWLPHFQIAGMIVWTSHMVSAQCLGEPGGLKEKPCLTESENR